MKAAPTLLIVLALWLLTTGCTGLFGKTADGSDPTTRPSPINTGRDVAAAVSQLTQGTPVSAAANLIGGILGITVGIYARLHAGKATQTACEARQAVRELATLLRATEPRTSSESPPPSVN